MTRNPSALALDAVFGAARPPAPGATAGMGERVLGSAAAPI
jgi:hypothetical protein